MSELDQQQTCSMVALELSSMALGMKRPAILKRNQINPPNMHAERAGVHSIFSANANMLFFFGSPMPTVLIAEDNPDARESLTEALRIAGYTVLAAQDGQVAIEIAKVFKPDVVLTDIDMPGLDGLSLCFQIKANPDLENIPVVLLSGRLPIYQPEAVFDVIQKPLLIEEVLSSVRAATTIRHRAA